MELEQIRIKTKNLTQRVTGINSWIKSNPHITDPNVYEIMDCNISLAEIYSEYATTLASSGEILNTPMLEMEMDLCYSGTEEMAELRDIAHHPFFQSKEANALYTAVNDSCLHNNYIIPEEPESRRIKKELLCKSMSVPFYIWQVHRTEPEYEYDNIDEFNNMKTMLDIYKQEGNTQFVPEIEAMFSTIERNYKYSDGKTATNMYK